ncbi:TSUP family transporter [Polymorphobacter fuscus]|uniref:Probable membrane transporter protein n=2 Tax=Sandarakinorhabdus fusca TaxID=1439888 RepID=A0A7C9GWI5_9SPHN|nr:TSUP family transporter [Polymorphobacter fuscus]MQT18258.1 TSUP family transporter [Polymorphobacter fuscus]
MVLVVTAIAYAIVLLRTASRRGALGLKGEGVALGAVTNFFDTLGIGSFAPTTAWLKLRKLVPDSFIPGVMISGYALPTLAQGLIYITLVEVDPVLLVAAIAAAVAGALVGAPVAVRLPVRTIQLTIGIALLLAGGFFAAAGLGLMPAGGEARSLAPLPFAIVLVGSFIIGALMTVGIGFYAPMLAMFSLFGLNPVAVFPIMAGAGALMMPASALRFIKSDRIDLKLVLSLALGGIPAVLVAAYIVKSLPLATLRWVVVAVVLYTGVVMLRAAARGRTVQPA